MDCEGMANGLVEECKKVITGPLYFGMMWLETYLSQ